MIAYPVTGEETEMIKKDFQFARYRGSSSRVPMPKPQPIVDGSMEK